VAKIREDAPFDKVLLHRLRSDHRHWRRDPHSQSRGGSQCVVFGLGGIGLNVVQAHAWWRRQIIGVGFESGAQSLARNSA